MNTPTNTPELTASAEIVNEQSLLKEIAQLYGEIFGLAESALEKAIRIGAQLRILKATREHGEWQRYVKMNLPFSLRTASDYMRAAEATEENPQLLEDAKGKTLERLLSLIASPKKPEQPKASPDAAIEEVNVPADEAPQVVDNNPQLLVPEIEEEDLPEPETSRRSMSPPATRTVTSFTKFVTERSGKTRYDYVAVDLTHHQGADWDLRRLNSAASENACVVLQLNAHDIPRAIDSSERDFAFEGMIGVTAEELLTTDAPVPITPVLVLLKGHSDCRGRLQPVLLHSHGEPWYERVLEQVMSALKTPMPKEALIYPADDLVDSDQAA
jgi:hypothetical protein